MLRGETCIQQCIASMSQLSFPGLEHRGRGWGESSGLEFTAVLLSEQTKLGVQATYQPRLEAQDPG